MGAYNDYNKALREAEENYRSIKEHPNHDAEDEMWALQRIADIKSALLEMAEIDGLDDPYEAFDYCCGSDECDSHIPDNGYRGEFYERRYKQLTERYEKAKAKYDGISEQIEQKKAKRELFKGFIRTLEKQDGLR